MKKFSGGERSEVILNEVILKSVEPKLFTAAEKTITTSSFKNTEQKAF